MEIDGKKLAGEIIDALKQKPTPKKFMAVFLVGDDPASASFVRQKEKTGKTLGIDFRVYRFPDTITSDELRREVGKTALQKKCGGVVVQLPLPDGVNAQYVLNAIPREKDVDVLGERALGSFYTGRNPVTPPAVGTVECILQASSFQLSAVRAAVVGRGALVGRPVALWLMDKVAELAVFTSKTEKMEEKLKEYDLIVSGVGKAGLIKPEQLKEGAIVIDFGYDEVDGEVRGDFAVPNELKAESYKLMYTPTPGGTGPVLVAQLFKNFYILTH